jgi:hypothetical protein
MSDTAKSDSDYALISIQKASTLPIPQHLFEKKSCERGEITRKHPLFEQE